MRGGLGAGIRVFQGVDDSATTAVAPYINRCSRHIEHSVDGQDYPLQFEWQSDRLKHDCHHDQSGMWDPCGADTGQQRRQGDDELLRRWQRCPGVQLSNKQNGNRLV